VTERSRTLAFFAAYALVSLIALAIAARLFPQAIPIVNLDVNVILDKTHQFVPGLRAPNFLVLEDGVPQTITSVRMAQAPITAVMLLEFAANSYYFIRDMQNASFSFFNTLRPDDYVAVVTYDLRTHILTDFTNNKQIVGNALSSLIIPGFSDTNVFDALYETLDRVSRIEGRKYIILIGTGRDTFSKLTLDKILAKVKAAQNVTIFTIGTGALVRELVDARGGMGSIARLDYLQADNQMKTFARMTGGLSFNPMFQALAIHLRARRQSNFAQHHAVAVMSNALGMYPALHFVIGRPSGFRIIHRIAQRAA